jgi:purine-binding chemotaxis protein CheW
MQVEEILIIKNGSESYGISTQDINQISRVPMLLPLPFRPFGVRGLCAVSGNIVSMIDMNLLLNIQEVDQKADKSRLLSLNGEYASYALLVSEVYNTVNVEQDKIEYVTKENSPVIAIYKYKQSLVQIICLDVLFAKMQKVQITQEEIKNGKVNVENTKEEDTQKFLIFSLGKEKYALHIDYLSEIVLSDVEYTEIIDSAREVIGLITLREELLTVIDLRIYYGFEAQKCDKNRILVASLQGRKLGLLVDQIIDIKSYANKDIEYMSKELEHNNLSGIIHDSSSLISFFAEDVLEKLYSANDSFIDSQESENQITQTSQEVMEVIVFQLAQKEYAFEIEYVAEIVDIIDSTQIPFSDPLVDGIINIRGQIITVLSLFKKLNIAPVMNEDSKIIICNLEHEKVGFIVDKVSDIINLNRKDIQNSENSLFKNILHLNDGERLILSIDIKKIMSK